MEDVTNRLLKDTGVARNEVGERLLKATPAKVLDDRLTAVINDLRKLNSDVTIGFISGPLVYSHFIRSKKANTQNAIYRMLKGGFLIVIEHLRKPVEGTNAYRDARYSDRYYEVAMNPLKF